MSKSLSFPKIKYKIEFIGLESSGTTSGSIDLGKSELVKFPESSIKRIDTLEGNKF